MLITPDLVATARAVESLQATVNGVLFYTPKWYCLDNFSAFNVVYEGILYPTVEHAYQALKFIYATSVDNDEIVDLRANYAEVIRSANSAHDAKKLAHTVALLPHVRKDWDDVKVWMMEQLLRAKHERHEYVRKILKRTKGLVIVEDSPTDSFWGRGSDWQGQNHLGCLWMKIRDEE
jgi:ribA/ribD-fused uncharacterized protein